MYCQQISTSKLNQSKFVSLYTISLLLDLTLNKTSIFYNAKLYYHKGKTIKESFQEMQL